MNNYIGTGLCCVLLTCCATTVPQVNAIPVKRMNDVIGEIKRQVSIYETEIGKRRRDPANDKAFVNRVERVSTAGKGKLISSLSQ